LGVHRARDEGKRILRIAYASDDGIDILVEHRHINRHPGQTEKDAVVLDGVMGRSHHAVAVAAAVTDKLDRKAVERDVVADLLKGRA
jgi:hypothetical protein